MASDGNSRAPTSNKIVHDAEYYILEAQHGARWASEDQDLDAYWLTFGRSTARPPNIIHIMWDDTAVGEVGIPAIQKLQGFETPNINRLAAEGINFMRMYSEPSCTPSRAAVMTGRHAVRNGMFNVSFPYEYGGLAASEVTTAQGAVESRLRDGLLWQGASRRRRRKLHDQPRLRRGAMDAVQPGAEPLYAARADGRAGARRHVPANVWQRPL